MYKTYKNKLNHILKCAEKKYYSYLLDSNKDNKNKRPGKKQIGNI